MRRRQKTNHAARWARSSGGLPIERVKWWARSALLGMCIHVLYSVSPFSVVAQEEDVFMLEEAGEEARRQVMHG